MRRRNNERRHLDTQSRILLLEEDIDNVEYALKKLQDEVKRTNRILMGLLAAVVSGIIIYAGEIVLDAAFRGG